MRAKREHVLAISSPRTATMPSPKDLLGDHPSSQRLSEYINSLASLVSSPDAAIPEVKSYRDAVYFNYYPLGLSLLFSPQNDYKPTTGLKREDLQVNNLILDSVDIYNVPKPVSSLAEGAKMPRMAELAFASYPVSPLVLPLVAQAQSAEVAEPSAIRPTSFDVQPSTSGKDFVATVGEPDRKGGGAGPSSGSIGIWCEWSKEGIMVEFGGEEARGPQAWERGKDAVWRVITVFSPKSAS